MIIQSVTIENFRSFYGEQTINFSVDPQKNTTIVYALNGVGKSNLLNAILWCLHGTFSRGFTKPNDILNWEAKKRGRKSYHVSVSFVDESVEYLVKRSGGEITNFKVIKFIEGNASEITINPAIFINSIIPRDMAGYFINDGEGSDLDVDINGMISISRSIKDILGFQVAERSLNDLAKIKREMREELKRLDVDKQLADYESELQKIEDQLGEDIKNVSENKSLLEKYKLQKDRCDRDLRETNITEVRNMQRQRKLIEQDIKSTTEELRKFEDYRVSLIRQYSWVVFSSKLLDEGLDFINMAEIEGTIPAPFNTQLVKDILKRAECICGACIKEGTPPYEAIIKLLDKGADEAQLGRLQRARARLLSVETLIPQSKSRLEDNFGSTDRARRAIENKKLELDEISRKIEAIDDQKLEGIEKERRTLIDKIQETERAIGRKENAIQEAYKSKNKLDDAISRIQGLSPRALQTKKRIQLTENIESAIRQELLETEKSIRPTLETKINYFLERYLRQEYKVKITDDFKLGLTDLYGNPIPASGGQSAILSFMYISSLIAIARERRDIKSNILTPGAIAPLIFDAPFSHLDPNYAPSVARELPKLVDQLIIFMYPDPSKDIATVISEEGKLGREFYLHEELSADQDTRKLFVTTLAGQQVAFTSYECPINKVIIKELKSHV
jgi:DNA sulfur modification protein DndD